MTAWYHIIMATWVRFPLGKMLCYGTVPVNETSAQARAWTGTVDLLGFRTWSFVPRLPVPFGQSPGERCADFGLPAPVAPLLRAKVRR